MKLLLFILPIFLTCQVENEYYDVAQKNIIKYNPPRKDYVIIIDYTKSILTERLYVIDMKSGDVVIKSKVAHAFKSGVLYPKDFSNVPGTNKSSSGNFVTCGTAYGKFGYSMIIKGLDKGINDNVKKRAIIFHSDKKMSTPWSLGCFATPEDINKEIIDLTQNGCLVSVIK
jgi:hypothetical protein